MCLDDFIVERFGGDKVELLNNIRRGGDNNSKGSTYEQFYAVKRILKIAANEARLDDFEISSQERAFVDDLAIRQLSTKSKHNFQLKNSNGNPAIFTNDTKERFELQREIDLNFFKLTVSKQYLIVSCEDKAKSNKGIIANFSLQEDCACEYSPYSANSFGLISSDVDLRSYLINVCGTDETLTLDTAFKLVLSVWAGNNSSQSVLSIMSEAEKMARPNIFKKGIYIPLWLSNKVKSFQGMEIRVESGSIKVFYGGFEVAIGDISSSLSKEHFDTFTTPEDFIMFLMTTTLSEFTNEE